MESQQEEEHVSLYDEFVVDLTEKQRQFVRHYVDTLNATEAARLAGYSEKTARAIGCENLTKPNIKKAIAAILEAVSMSDGEALVHVTDIARTRINDYLIPEKVLRRPQVRKPLAVLIQEIELEIWREDEFDSRGGVDAADKAKFDEKQKDRRNQILRFQIELEQNPDAYRDVHGEAVWVDDVRFDLVALANAKREGRIKSLSFNEHGPRIEMESPLAALKDLLQIHGRFIQKIEAKVEKGEDINVWSPEDMVQFYQWKLSQEGGQASGN